MMMRYQRSTVSKRAVVLLGVCAGIVLVMILLFRSTSTPSLVTQVTHVIASPVWLVRDRIVLASTAAYESLAARRTLVQENLTLQEALRTTARDRVALASLVADNEHLRAMLGRATSSDAYQLASVLHGAAYAPYDTFIVDVGHDAAITPGMVVLSEDGFAVGVVAQVYARTAVVAAFSATGFRWYAVLDTMPPVHIELEGVSAGTMRALVPRDVSLSVDQTLRLPNLPGNPAGTIAAIEMQPEDAYQTVYVRLTVNPRHVRFVLIDTTYVWRVDARDQTALEVVAALNQNSTTTSSVPAADALQ